MRNLHQVIKEVIDAVIVGAEGKLLLCWNRKYGLIQRISWQGFPQERFEFFEWELNYGVGEVLDLREGRDVGVKFFQIRIVI